jgi:hypothetical protein
MRLLATVEDTTVEDTTVEDTTVEDTTVAGRTLIAPGFRFMILQGISIAEPSAKPETSTGKHAAPKGRSSVILFSFARVCTIL